MRSVKITKKVNDAKELVKAFDEEYSSIDGSQTKWYTDILSKYADKVNIVVEYGTWDGLGTASLLVGEPKILRTIDVNQNKIDKELFNKVSKKTQIFIETGNSHNPQHEADLIFLDTIHTYEHVKKELEVNGPLTKKYIIVHDTNYPPPRKSPKKLVRDAVLEFLEKSDFSLELEDKSFTGIMVLKKNEN